MRIRLLGTLLSFALVSQARAQEPICVIDGIRHPPGDCFNLSPQRIARVEVFKGAAAAVQFGVIKGAAAAAQFGVEGDHGIISVTLKPGSSFDASGDDPLAHFLFPPELVMANQQAIGLTERQRTAIMDEVKEAQNMFVGLKFALSGEVEKLQGLLQGASAEERRVQAQVDRVLDVEREIKHTQLTMMIRIKNQLTESQQATLARLRR